MKKYFLFLGLLFFVSCKKADGAAKEGFAFYFEGPQPINDSELSKFPNKFKGIYIDSDSSFFKIEDDKILTESYLKFKIHKKELDSLKKDFVFFNGKLIEKRTNELFNLIEKGDSLELIKKYTDTIFRFSNYQKVKRINGDLVLSMKDSVFWRVKILSLEEDVLKVKYIYSPEDLKRFDSITKEKSKMIDSTSFIIRPTRREFKSILNLKHLGREQQFTKVKK